MSSSSKKILIIGTGNMACTYFRHFKSLGCTCFMSYRNIESKNTQNAIKTFGSSSLIIQENSYKINPDIVITCTNVESHLLSLLPFINNKKCFLISEKPLSFSLDEIKNFPRKDVYILMNRRYYSWVENLKNLASQGKIKKIIVNIPERYSQENIDGIPKLILENSIHVFDLIYFISGNFIDSKYTSENIKSKLIITRSQNVNEIIFNINFDSVERFNINFYLCDNTVIKSEPIEKAFHYKTFEIIPPKIDNYVKQFVPKYTELTPVKNKIDYQKNGVLELCEDLVKVDKLEDTKLPNISSVISFLNWLTLTWNRKK